MKGNQDSSPTIVQEITPTRILNIAQTTENQPNINYWHFWRVQSWCPDLQFLRFHHHPFESYAVPKISPLLTISELSQKLDISSLVDRVWVWKLGWSDNSVSLAWWAGENKGFLLFQGDIQGRSQLPPPPQSFEVQELSSECESGHKSCTSEP